MTFLEKLAENAIRLAASDSKLKDEQIQEFVEDVQDIRLGTVRVTIETIDEHDRIHALTYELQELPLISKDTAFVAEIISVRR